MPSHELRMLDLRMNESLASETLCQPKNVIRMPNGIA